VAITYIGTTGNYNNTSAVTLDSSETLNIFEGDLLVIICKWEGATTNAHVDDGNSNDFITTGTEQGTTDIFSALGYVIANADHANATITMTLDDARGYRGFQVAQFRPGVGTTIIIDGGITEAEGSNTNPTSTTFSTTGDDGVVFIGIGFYDVLTIWQDHLIALAAAEGNAKQSISAGMFYTIFESAQTDIYGECTTINSAWMAWKIAFKSVAAGGATLDQKSFRFRNDDGDEDAATWLASQGADITREKNLNTRIRMLLQSTGNPDSAQYQLEYKKSTDSIWRKVI
jgi:hypothetical protein